MIQIRLKNKNEHPIIFGVCLDDGMIFERVSDIAPKKNEAEILKRIEQFPNMRIEKIKSKNEVK